MKNFFITITNPRLWLMHVPFSLACEQFSLEALKAPVFTNISEYKCQFNGKTIWIGNGYYGFEFYGIGLRPSRATALKIFAALDEHRFKT